jgi:hypothetical protein
MAAVARASYNAYVSWSAYNVGLLSFDHSLFDGTDVFGVSPLDASFGGTYDDVSKILDTATVTRGRSNKLDTMLAGSASVDLRDPAGLFNPENASGPLYGQLEDRLHPVKLTATQAGVGTFGLFYGWVNDFAWQPSGRRGITRLNCVDLFYWLQRATPIIASTGVTTTGAAIGKILDAVGATDIGMRDLGVGDSIPDFSADGTKTGLDLIQGLLEAERGVFFVAGTGKATYRSRLDRLTRTSVHTFTDTFTGAEPGVDWNQAYTRVVVTRTQTGYTATAVSSAGVAKSGYNDLPAISTPYLSADSQADALAAWVLSQNVSPKPPTRDFTIDNRTADLLTQALTRELVDRITATESRGGSSGDYHIDSISHTIDNQGGHSATWLLSKASPLTPIVFDMSVFDGPNTFL